MNYMLYNQKEINLNYLSKRIMLDIIFLNGIPALSQKMSVLPGLGLGSTLAKNEAANKKGRVMIGLSSYYNLTKQLSFGIEVATAGSFIIGAKRICLIRSPTQ